MAFAQQAAISIEDTRLIGRSAMLQESHHRIKNNLQAISSYIALQKRYISQEYKNEVEIYWIIRFLELKVLPLSMICYQKINWDAVSLILKSSLVSSSNFQNWNPMWI